MATRSGFSKRSQVFVWCGHQTLSLLSVMILHHRIGGYGIGTLKAVPHIMSVGADLPEFVNPAQRNAGSLSLARDPYFPIVQ